MDARKVFLTSISDTRSSSGQKTKRLLQTREIFPKNRSLIALKILCEEKKSYRRVQKFKRFLIAMSTETSI